MSVLTPEDQHRYARQTVLPEIGEEGQVRLKAASVLVVGVGGLGSPSALYLAAAGVGRIGLVDFDRVDETNLQRQIIHSTQSVGMPKVDSAAESILALNPAIDVVRYQHRLTPDNAIEILRDYDLVIDGSDNFPTRYLVNDACALLGKLSIYGAVSKFEGQVSVFEPQGPCYRCLFPEPPSANILNCEQEGVLGVLPGLVGVIQATECLKIMLGIGSALTGRLLLIDALDMRFREIQIHRDPACPVCGGGPSAQPWIETVPEITVSEYRIKVQQGDRHLLIDVREPYEVAVNQIPGAILIPLNTLPDRIQELNRDMEIVVYCQSGSRSAYACEHLRGLGFQNVRNLAGGIQAWHKT